MRLFRSFGVSLQIIALAAIAIILAWSAVSAQINVDGRGNRIDSPGVLWSCPVCPGVLPTQVGHYDYECRECGAKFTCKLDPNGRRVFRSITRRSVSDLCGK